MKQNRFASPAECRPLGSRRGRIGLACILALLLAALPAALAENAEQTSFEQMCTVLTGILRDYNTSYIEAVFFKGVLQTQNVCVIRDPQITAYFVCFYVGSAYDDDDLGSI